MDVNYVIDTIQQILNKAHTNDDKRKLDLKQLKSNKPCLVFACPICKDSSKSIKMKRARLYLANFYMKCYNEDSCSRSFVNLCKTFNIEIDPEKKLEIYNHIETTIKYQPKDDYVSNMMDKLINLNDFIAYCDTEKSQLRDLKPIEKDSPQNFYLNRRLVFNKENIYQGNYKVTNTWIEPVVVILNKNGNNLLGAEIRNLKEEKTKRIYKVFDFEYIYRRIYLDKEIEENEMNVYKKNSHLLNILNVDFENKVTICEGYFDSTFFPNSIGLCGRDTRLDILIDNGIDMRFVFDNDDAGVQSAISYMENGYSVFLWKKLLSDLKIKKEIKDINKLAEYFKNANIYNDLNLDNYFSIDKYDKLWI